jgi:plastocyanin
MEIRYVSNRMRGHAAAVLLGAALIAISGCASQQAATATMMGPAATVSMTRGAFDPMAVTVKAGDEVAWRNDSVSFQSVTATAFRSGMIAPGASFSNTFAMAGTYHYSGAGGTPVGAVIVEP